ncbi:MAG TPA: GTP 3',8-cyclase MoaA, partial [Candidatus Omnitrophota bacterium]|nr:GTP 3',8-cyclase MoaA [Candidatus Omnitrophota bacterium]
EYSQHYQFLKKEEWLNFDEIFRLTKLFVSLGVLKVRLTGGEPLLRPGLPELIARLSKISQIEDLALTTNGSLLRQQAQTLKSAGLKRLTVSLDTLDEEIFYAMSGNLGSVAEVLEGIKEAQRVGFKKIKINVVIQKGINDHTVLDLVKYFKGTGHIIRFIEYMDVGNCNHWKSTFVVPSSEIVRRIHVVFPLKPVEANYPGEVASRYEYLDGSSEIGFISSVTQPFCGTCSRARLSTDGKIYTCLFAGQGTDLRSPLRNGASDKKLLEIITDVWEKRADRYSEERLRLSTSQKTPARKVEMFQIGG